MKTLIKKLLTSIRPFILLIESRFDRSYLVPDVPIANLVSHQKWLAHLHGLANKPGVKFLEIGSRGVTGTSQARKLFDKAHYIGFDYYPGINVDIVGDAHKLSSYFESNEQFDLIYSSACMEHFAMPWLVAEEISKMLKVGGYVFIETHSSYSSHERPWHFFQFSDMALQVLFSKSLGFECIESGMSNPMVGRFSSLADKKLKNKPIKGLYCHSEYLGRKFSSVSNFSWNELDLSLAVNQTTYPKPTIVG